MRLFRFEAMLSVGLFFMLLFACKDDNKVNSLTVSTEFIEIPAEGGSVVFTLSTDAGAWQIDNSSPDWIELSVAEGSGNQAMVTVSVSSLTLEARSGTLTLHSGNAVPIEIVVTQGASDYLYSATVSVTSLSLPLNGGHTTFRLTTSAPQWLIATDVDWLIVDQTSGTQSPITILVTAPANTSETIGARVATITITAEHTPTVTVVVSQAGQLYPSYNLSPVAPDLSGMGSNATELAAKMVVGWNLGNSLEATGSETSWGNPRTSKAIIDMVKAAGFNAVRIPCAWNQYANQSTAKINDNWLARVKEVVDYCIDNDMYAILNIHWDGGWLENNISADKKDEVNMKQKAFWEQIATHFRDYDERLIFAGTNEPHAENAASMSVLHSYLQTFVDAVRATGGRNHYRNLIVQGPVTDIDKTNSLMNTLPTDAVPNRMMVEVHYYTPWTFCGLEADASWGRAAWYWGQNYQEPPVNGINRNASTGEAEVLSLFGKMKTKFVDKGIPVILGEYGVINRSNLITDPALRERHQESRAYYLKYVTRKMKEYGMVPFYWDNGHLSHSGGVGNNSFAIFNRNTRTVIDQTAIDAIIEGAAASYPF
ncbi:cellulase family glycosylhydrolase [Alkaliflexus imshenetskii]|uniref:cellulase family glycosylhydrolase n=1 Tax=Alkaliflexus imshenetskii TaxID=286730 RepID=UPI0004BB0534|nr:cellulase family glycosylhydrolase [Alkaliflexus imshenetskii]